MRSTMAVSAALSVTRAGPNSFCAVESKTTSDSVSASPRPAMSSFRPAFAYSILPASAIEPERSSTTARSRGGLLTVAGSTGRAHPHLQKGPVAPVQIVGRHREQPVQADRLSARGRRQRRVVLREEAGRVERVGAQGCAPDRGPGERPRNPGHRRFRRSTMQRARSIPSDPAPSSTRAVPMRRAPRPPPRAAGRQHEGRQRREHHRKTTSRSRQT